MWFRVASLLGGRTVEELKSEMTYSEFLEWVEFYSIEPWGFHIENLFNGVVASTVDNCRMTTKVRHQFAKPRDYMVLQKDKPQSVENIHMKLLLSGIPVIDKRNEK